MSPKTAGRPSPREKAAGRYEVREQLAKGGMGAIYRAYDRLAQRDVAYKRLDISKESSRARKIALFQNEYDTLARLPHPNIVEVYDYGKDEFGPYYVMELLTGSDLTALSPLPYREACRVLRDIASALALLHARRLVHRDVSPNNVRLTHDGRAKLIDFGALSPFGKPKEVVGTPAFIAPESLQGIEIDRRSDLYSLGAVGYWALTKRTAVRARSFDELLLRIDDPIVAPSIHVPEIPPELDALIMSMLASDPLARPPSTAYLIDRLTSIADLEPELDERRVAFSYLAHPPLSGRSGVLSALNDALDECEAGRGKSVLIEGQAGNGRSAVLEALVLQAQLRGALVLRARGDRSAGPFGIASKLTELAVALFPDLQEAADAQRSFTALAARQKGKNAPSPVEIADRHALLIASVQRALLEVSRKGPLVVVVDDLHLADSESLALLASLAQELAAQRILLVTSALSGGDPHTLDSALTKLRACSVRQLLSPLDEKCMLDLVESIFGGVPNTRRTAQWLQDQSGGVPAHALNIARLLLRTGLIRYTLGTFTLPHDYDVDVTSINLSSAILGPLTELDASAQELARLLCLHDGSLTPEQLAAAVKRAPRDVLLSLEELKSLNIVSNSPDGFALAGSSLRAALKLTLPSEHKQKLHLELGRALMRQGQEAIEARIRASLHLLDGGAIEEAIAVVPEVRAGIHAAPAIRLLEAALEYFRTHRRAPEQSIRVLIALVYAGFYGDIAAQRRHIEQALAWMARLCGMQLAMRLRPYLGGKLALVLGILYAAARRRFTAKADRLGTVPEMISEFIGLVVAGAASAASSMDSAAAYRYARWLEPLSAMPKQSSAALMREYTLAICETSAGNFGAASARYAELIPTFSKPVLGLDDPLRQAIYLGALNGRAQAEASSSTPMTLELADELGRGDPFYAPHAECARMSYYASRGELEKAEVHRARAELLALRGGTSWSAVTVLTVRRAYGAMLTRDAIGLVQTIAELDRLSGLAPKLATCKLICEAWLESLRGRHQQSIALFEQVIDGEDARQLASWRVDRTLFATVLNEAGEYTRAKQMCQALLDQLPSGHVIDATTVLPTQQIAIAEARMGDVKSASARLEHMLEMTKVLTNPLQLGMLHRDRALVAIAARDRAAFDLHFAMMDSYFQETRNPSLIQLRDPLLAEASRTGVRPNARLSVPIALEEELDGSTHIEGAEDLLPTKQKASGS